MLLLGLAGTGFMAYRRKSNGLFFGLCVGATFVVGPNGHLRRALHDFFQG